jgi:hypothetical protein
MGLFKSLAFCTCLLSGLLAHHAEGSEVIDIRECPLDTLTFVDPWAGGTFAVRQVGTAYKYICDGGIVDEPREEETCSGPYGDLVLYGDLVEGSGSEAEPILAIWYVLKALPCCGWAIKRANPETMEGIKWLLPDEVPLLGEQGWLSIHPDDTDRILGNPKFAAKCTVH